MKPWGSQACLLHFSALLSSAEQRKASGGSRGAAMSPPVAARRGEICGTDASLTADRPQRLGDALDYSSCGTLRAMGCRPRYPDTPRRPFVRTCSAGTL